MPMTVETALSGYELLNDPLLNKGTAFTEAERDEFELHGLLPPYVTTLDLQVERRLDAFRDDRHATCENTCFCAARRIPTRRCFTRS